MSSSSSSAVEAVDRAGDVGVLDPWLESPRPSCAGAAGGRGIVDDGVEDDVVAKVYTGAKKKEKTKELASRYFFSFFFFVLHKAHGGVAALEAGPPCHAESDWRCCSPGEISADEKRVRLQLSLNIRLLKGPSV